MSATWQSVTDRMWDAFAQRGTESATRQSQLFIINIFSVLAFFALGVFGLLQIVVEGQPALGYLELFGSGIVALNMVGLRLSHNIALARNLLLLCMLVYLMVMLMTGGTQGTGVFWFFMFPISAFFLTGKRQGLYWMAGLVIATLAFLLLDMAGAINLPYSPLTIRQLLISVLVVSVGIYFYELAREGMERQIRREQDDLDKAKNEFLSLASHQLRTPIAAISWFSEMMLHGDTGKLHTAQKDYLTQIYDSNQRSVAIVDAMITVSNLQSGALAMHLEATDVAALCRRIVKGQKESFAKAKQLKVTEHYATLPKLTCDPSLMRTIVQNLLSNAFKYTPEGGEVTVTAERSAKRLTFDSKGSIQITIADTGYGIPKNQQGKIFAKLFRASNIKAKDTDGTGLGLYIVKTILEQVGGKIDFSSEEDKGSTFVVTLPLEGMRQARSIGGKYV